MLAGCWEGLAGLVAPERGDLLGPSLPPSGEGSKLGISVGPARGSFSAAEGTRVSAPGSPSHS